MRLLILLLALALSACTMQPVAPERLATYKRIGVLSVMGDDFWINAVGVTVFGNEEKVQKLDIGADATLLDAAQQALQQRYELVDLSKYRDAFMATDKQWPGQDGPFSRPRPKVSDVVRDMMGNEKLDAYVFITPSTFQVRNTNQRRGGIGIIKLQRIFGTDDYLLHLAHIVTVVDGRDFTYTGDMIARPLGEGLISTGFDSSRLSVPNAPVPQTFWMNPSGNIDQIRRVFGPLALQSVARTLRAAGMIN